MTRSVTSVYGPARVVSRFDPRTTDIVHGIATSAIGAVTVAVFFLILDTLQGHPLWTPAALGAQLFWDQPLDPAQPIPLVLVLGFTAMHAGVFLGFGMVAAAEFALHYRTMSAPRFVTVFIALFMSLQATFLTFGLVLLDPTTPEFPGIGPITAANFLSAGTMTLYLALVERAARRARPAVDPRPLTAGSPL